MGILSKIRDVVLSLVTRPDPSVIELENMSPAEFSTRTEQVKIGREVPRAVILFEYGDPLVRKAVWEIKFRGNKRIARLIATLLHDELIAALSEEKMFGRASRSDARPLLLPIPISGERYRERGWNQCELIADELARLDDGENFEVRKNILIKNKNTADQVGKGRAERLKNLQNSFDVRDNASVKDRFVIILDDVVTTGATIEEAGRALRAAGSKKILFLAIAH